MKKVILAALINFLMWGFVIAQEHPEHPKGTAKKETPSLTTAELAKAVKNYVEEDAQLKGGYFLVYDQAIKQSLELTLDKVHEDKLSKVAENSYFACSDFKATNGKMYDLDFFMKQGENGLTVTEISIHKEEGKPRYTWAEEKGLWVRKPASK